MPREDLPSGAGSTPLHACLDPHFTLAECRLHSHYSDSFISTGHLVCGMPHLSVSYKGAYPGLKVLIIRIKGVLKLEKAPLRGVDVNSRGNNGVGSFVVRRRGKQGKAWF